MIFAGLGPQKYFTSFLKFSSNETPKCFVRPISWPVLRFSKFWSLITFSMCIKTTNLMCVSLKDYKTFIQTSTFCSESCFSNFQTQIRTWSKKRPYETPVYFLGSLVIYRNSTINAICVLESSNIGNCILKTFFSKQIKGQCFFFTDIVESTNGAEIGRTKQSNVTSHVNAHHKFFFHLHEYSMDTLCT